MGCCCMGPQRGEPLCPCQMRAARQHFHILDPLPPPSFPALPRGCVCPAGAEATCQGFACPRKPLTIT